MSGATLRIGVVGDSLLDRDLLGTVERVCPDAPAPVVDVRQEVTRPGGAALAAVLLADDGHDVTLVTAIADDPPGRELRALLDRHGVRLALLPVVGDTREKVRIRAGGQSVARLDRGTAEPASGERSVALAALDGVDAVLVSDYGGGVTALPELRAALETFATRRPLVWDPHPRGSTPVRRARLVTPNRAEAGVLREGLAATHRRAEELRRAWAARAVAVTLGDRGALVALGAGAPLVVPAGPVQGGDTCGAGDRFASTVTALLAAGDVVSDSVQTAVTVATDFVARGGAATVGTQGHAPTASGADRVVQARARGGTVVATGGCFDLLHAGHVALLRDARTLGDCLVVTLNSDASVRRLKGDGRPLVPQEDRVRVLESLEYVDAVEVFDEDTPEVVLRRIRPDIWAKGGDYALADLPEAPVVQEWGGQVVVLPYLAGRSTTRLIGAARERSGDAAKMREEIP